MPGHALVRTSSTVHAQIYTYRKSNLSCAAEKHRRCIDATKIKLISSSLATLGLQMSTYRKSLKMSSEGKRRSLNWHLTQYQRGE